MNLWHMLPSILWTVAIIILYALPGNDLPATKLWDVLPLDKVAHFAVFALYACMLCIGLSKQEQMPIKRMSPSWHAILWGLIFGSILEAIQGAAFVQRTTDIMDMLANAAGMLVGYVIFTLLYRR
jgi:glycopeptide antibiotics resistance protein